VASRPPGGCAQGSIAGSPASDRLARDRQFEVARQTADGRVYPDSARCSCSRVTALGFPTASGARPAPERASGVTATGPERSEPLGLGRPRADHRAPVVSGPSPRTAPRRPSSPPSLAVIPQQGRNSSPAPAARSAATRPVATMILRPRRWRRGNMARSVLRRAKSVVANAMFLHGTGLARRCSRSRAPRHDRRWSR
jgi:hypothetical protein